MNLVSRLTAAECARAHPGLVAVLLLLSSLDAVAVDAPLGLDEAIQRALGDSPQIIAAQASLEGAQDLAPSAGRLPDPQVIVGVDNLPVNAADQFSLTRDFMTMRKVGVMQTFPSGAKRRLQGELATREIDVAQADLRASRYETAKAAAEAWIACATAEQSLQRVRELRSDLTAQSSAARAALASGRSNAGEALTSEAALARLDGRVLKLEQQLSMRRAEFARWVGQDASRNLADLPWQRELGGAPQTLAQDVAAHPPLAPSVAGLEVARTEVMLARAEKRPDWSAELSFAKRGPDYSDMVSLEFRVDLPWFAKHRQNPVIAAKLANVRALEASQEAEIRMHRAEIESMFAMWQSGRARLQHFEKELLPLARDRSRVVLNSYGSGRGDMRSALEALGDEADLQLEYIELEGDVTRAWAYLHLLHSTADVVMNASTMSSRGWIVAGLALLVSGAAGGYWIANHRGDREAAAVPAAGERKVLYWHDPMTPNVRFDKPGKSPFMDMQLVPVYADEGSNNSGVRVASNVTQSFGIRIAKVEEAAVQRKLKAVGSVAFDDQLLEVVPARVEGYVTRLLVRSALEKVRRGQALAEIQAPAWIEAQQEYLSLLDAQSESGRALQTAARERLRILGVPEATVRRIEIQRKTIGTTTIVSPIDGVVSELGVREGAGFMPGAVMFRINGLSTVWVNARIPETQLSLVAIGSEVHASATAWPGATFKGRVKALLPQVDPDTRTSSARIALDNKDGKLSPGMFVSLELLAPATESQLLVPSEAVITTGERTVVIVANSAGAFSVVNVSTGAEQDGRTVILKGLSAGQSIVVSGQFLIDSEASLKSAITRLESPSAESPMEKTP